MRLTLLAHTTGIVLRLFGPLLALPIAVELLDGSWRDTPGFVLAGVSAFVVGDVLRRLHPGGTGLTRTEGMAVVSLVWLAVAVFGAIPYLWAGLGPVDSLFESMSGFTTTGATVMRDFGLYSRAIFFWRSLTQWLGGMGVIALFVAVLPALAVAGRQLFFAEAPGPSEERLTPRIRQTAIALWSIYLGLTLLEILLLLLTGMPLYDSVCNSLTTLAAGGFSPHPGSIGGYNNPAAEWVITLFMFLAGANFALQYSALRGRPLRLLRDEEFRAYVGIIVVSTLLLCASLYGYARNAPASYLEAETTTRPLHEATPLALLRLALFQSLSILTTTGFATDDFNLWGDGARVVLLVLMFIGGSAGSAAGGPKVVRVLLLFRHAVRELFRAAHPSAIKPVMLGGRPIPSEVMRAITTFLLLYLMTFAASTTVVVLLGLDLLSGLTASIATLGNIGPGYGVVGPMANFADLHPVSKMVLFVNMWVGRLEVMTVFVILQRNVWRGTRLSD